MTNSFVTKLQNYILPVGDSIHASWRLSECSLFQPTHHQTVLMDATRQALEEGLFYNIDVDNRVAELLQITHEQRAINTTNVCGGDFGYDVYFAQKAVRSQDSIKENNNILNQMSLKPGDVIGTLIFNDNKIIRLAKVESIDEGAIIITGSRGPKTFRFLVKPVHIKEAIDRASENGKRKASYVEFVSHRDKK